jgi:hypothetical protein
MGRWWALRRNRRRAHHGRSGIRLVALSSLHLNVKWRELATYVVETSGVSPSEILWLKDFVPEWVDDLKVAL